MAGGINFTSYVPTTLLGVNSASPTLAAEAVTGLPIPTGARPGIGNVFYLSESWAQQLSNNTCHAGWYAVVQVDAGATAANIAFGTIGAQLSLAKGLAVFTDVTHALYPGSNPCVFLGAVTPGNYTIVQLQGDGQVVAAASQTITPGTMLVSNASTATVATSSTYTAETVGVATVTVNSPGGALTLSAVAASSGGSAVYTGTITGGSTPNYIGLTFVIAGFTNAVNNGTFLCTACSTTTLTLSNPSAIAETHAGTATSQNLIRTNINFPFGIL
jgi:hypothetical protein